MCLGAVERRFGVLELESDPERAVEAIVEQAELAVRDDHAEVICLGCGGMAELEASRPGRGPGVPVVDGVAAAVTVAESLVRLGLATSKVRTYAPPATEADHRLAPPLTRHIFGALGGVSPQK